VRNQSLPAHDGAPSQSPATLYIAYQQSKEDETNSDTEKAVAKAVHGDQWIRDYFDNDYSIAVAILGIFIEETIPEISELENLLTSKGVDELHRKVHKINPSFKMIGQLSLAAELKDLENYCSSSPNTENLYHKIKTIQAETEKVKPLILNQYNTISKLA
jgi:HPt (histidine-containing phosphotransfer) domain-containing protein